MNIFRAFRTITSETKYPIMYTNLTTSASSASTSSEPPESCNKIERLGIVKVQNNASTTESLLSVDSKALNKTCQPKSILNKDEREVRKLERGPAEGLLAHEEYLRNMLSKRDVVRFLNVWAAYLLAKVAIYKQTGFDIGPKKLFGSIVLSSASLNEIVKKGGVRINARQYCKLRASYEDPTCSLNKSKMRPYLELTEDRIIRCDGDSGGIFGSAVMGREVHKSSCYDNFCFLGENAIDEEAE